MRRQVGSVMLARLLGMGLVFFSQVFLARHMTVEAFGVLVYLLSVVALAGLVAKFGLDTTAMRFVPSYRAQQAPSLLLGLVISIMVFVGLFGTAIYFALGQAVEQFSLLSQDYATYLPLLFGLLPMLPMQNLTAAILRGFEAQVWAELVDTTLRYCFVLVGLMFLLVSEHTVDVRSVLYVYTIATALCLLFGLSMILRQWPRDLRSRTAQLRLVEWGQAGAALTLTGGLYLLMNQADLLMLGQLADPENVGRYAVASRLTGIVGIGLGVVVIVVAPKLSAVYGRGGERSEMQALLNSAARLTFAIIALGASVLVLFGQSLLQIFGAEFLPAYVPLLILTSSRVVEAFAGPAGQLLAMVGLHNLVASLLIAPAVLNIALNAYLIPLYGESGAALSTLISAIVWNALLLVVSQRKLGLDPSLISAFGSK